MSADNQYLHLADPPPRATCECGTSVVLIRIGSTGTYSIPANAICYRWRGENDGTAKCLGTNHSHRPPGRLPEYLGKERSALR